MTQINRGGVNAISGEIRPQIKRGVVNAVTGVICVVPKINRGVVLGRRKRLNLRLKSKSDVGNAASSEVNAVNQT